MSSPSRQVAIKILEGFILQNPIKIINIFAWSAVSCLAGIKRGDRTCWTSLIGGEKLKVLKALPDKLNSCHPVDMVSYVKVYGSCLCCIIASYIIDS